MTFEVTILGCGSSTGVPAIGNNWGNCDPNNPKNIRMRSSILVKSESSTILIDAGPDLRQQLLNSNVDNLDAVFVTHGHADHIHGIDDFRFLNVLMNKDINLFASKKTIGQIKEKFGYVFEKLNPQANGYYYKPCLIPNIIKPSFQLNKLKIKTFDQNHGFSISTGFRINNIAISTDVVDLDAEAFDNLNNLDLWIVDCLRFKPHKTHAHLEKTLQWIDKVKPKKSILTHMNYEVDYDAISKMLPKNCYAAYDGMKTKV
ncbi:MBL fold metallo-hydrolase [Rickettsiales bacterium]|nr:MBL fold metallo-hydrolase [Rickettsiales bacterium]